MAWSLANLLVMDAPLMEALAAASIRMLRHLSPQDITNTAWAFATMALSNLPFIDALA